MRKSYFLLCFENKQKYIYVHLTSIYVYLSLAKNDGKYIYVHLTPTYVCLTLA